MQEVHVPFRVISILICALLAGAGLAQAQEPKPSAKDTAAIRGCAAKNPDDVDAAEQRCIFRLVAAPCTKRREAQTTIGMADCYRVEQMIWDALLAENLKKLSDDLDEAQKQKLKAMQEAWATARERTCAFYYDKIQGTLATPLGAACMARETAQRALLLRYFQNL
jgi:uncharacterized protein YecT (DUF1311 family)